MGVKGLRNSRRIVCCIKLYIIFYFAHPLNWIYLLHSTDSRLISEKRLDMLIIYAKFHGIFPKQSLHLSEICMKHFALCLFRCSGKPLSLGKFCSCSELVMPEKIYSLDQCITVVFRPYGSVPGEEFEAYYTSMDNTTELDPTSNCRSVNKI